MSDVYISLPDYLRSPCEHLWLWQDNGDSIVWSADPVTDAEESTAAFASQLHLILSELNERLGGLPPLICVLSVIDICSMRWSLDDCAARIARLAKASSRGRRRLESAAGPVVGISRWFSDVWLLPTEFRSDPESQIAILTYALQDAPPRLLESVGVQAADVLECISIAATDRDLHWASSALPIHSVARAKLAIETLLHMSSRAMDVETIQLWRRTSVGELPQPAPIEEPPKPRDPIARSIRELVEDNDWGAMARAAVSIASLLTLPRKPSDPEPLPVGGVSDVTNRGQPERLLMTELAQDSMVMLARIANGQALYLRRETPPGPSPQFRPVLIESGIRTWGTIRLQMASVALAIAAAEERRGETSAKLITVAGHRTIDEDFTTPAGVIEHLTRLEPDEHPGSAIQNWIRSLDSADQMFADPILIVSAATDRDQRFRRALDEMTSGYLIARVERDATVTLLRRTPLGDEALQTVSLNSVEAAHSETAKPSLPSLVRTPDSSLALFLDVHPCPLRFSDHLDGPWVLATDEPGLFTITRDRRLLYFDHSEAGAVQLADWLPVGHVLAYEVIESQLSLVLGDTNQDHYLIEVDPRTSVVQMLRLQTGGGRSNDYEFDQGNLYRFGSQVQLFCRVSGACLAADRVAAWRHVGGPVLYDGRDLRLVSREANRINYHTISEPMPGNTVGFATRRSDDVIALISNDYRQMVSLDDSLTVQALQNNTRRVWARKRIFKVDYRNAAGNVIVVSDGGSTMNRVAIDLELGTLSDKSLSNHRQLLSAHDRYANYLVNPRSVLARITGVRIVHGQTIVLMKRKHHWAIGYDSDDGKLVLQQVIAQPSNAKAYFFGRSKHVDSQLGSTRWSLRQAVIGNNHVIVDSRGLLHLRRGDDGSEVTLVMYQSHVSGWTSWGEQFGDGYFLDGGMRKTNTTVISWLKEFAQQCSQSS